MDRGGIVEDGPTHHGIVDISFWRSLPNLHILQPRDESEMRQMMDMALDFKVASVIRYPKTAATDLSCPRAPLELGKSEVIRDGKDAVIWASGRECEPALKTAEILAEKGVRVKVVNTRFLEPFDSEAFLADCADMPCITLEDHFTEGGLASIARDVIGNNANKGLLAKGFPKEIIPWGKTNDIREKYRLQPEQIAEDILKTFKVEDILTASK